MSGTAEIGDAPVGIRWRAAVWGGAAFLLLMPLIVMQFVEEVNWGAEDFLVMAAMLLTACGAYELAVRITRNRRYRSIAVFMIATAFILVWIELAVGIFN